MIKQSIFALCLASGAFVALGAPSSSAAEAPSPSLDEAGSCEMAEGSREGQRPQGPPRCEAEGDCVEHCPPDAIGCTCAPSPRGEKICVPVCASDEDCPASPHGQGPSLTCDTQQGICVPAHPPGGGRGPGQGQGPQR